MKCTNGNIDSLLSGQLHLHDFPFEMKVDKVIVIMFSVVNHHRVICTN